MTATLNPLHFEDLEPHRFEDLVRQIVYDFKEWSLLEPTGRLGSDDGYDARGFEVIRDGLDIDEEAAEDTEEDGAAVVDYEPDGVSKLKEWDYTDKTTLKPKDEWNDDPEENDCHQRVYSFWRDLDETKRAFFEVVGLIKV